MFSLVALFTETYHTEQVGFKLREVPVSASNVLRQQAYLSKPSMNKIWVSLPEVKEKILKNAGRNLDEDIKHK